MSVQSTLWRELLEYARWSPSPHNIQPWRVRVLSDSAAELLYEPTKLLPDTDPTGRFTAVGFGIFIEYLSIAAHAKGYELTCDYNNALLESHHTDLMPFARLTLAHATLKDDFSPDLLLKRQTSRLPYKDGPVSDLLQKKLRAIAEEFHQTIHISTDRTMVSWVLKLNRDTMFYDMDDPKSRNEVARWVRTTQAEADTKKDGLWSYCMRFPGWLMRIFFWHHEILKIPGIKQLCGALYLWSMRGTRTVAWIKGPFATPKEWLASGRMLARLWLCMTENGVYLHPFGSIITNLIAHDILRKKFDVDEAVEPLWLIVRMGHSNLPPHSHRFSVDDILVS